MPGKNSDKMNWFEAFRQVTEKSTQPAQQVVTATYGVSSANALKFTKMDDGFYIAQFVGNQAGIIKLSPGGKKKPAFSTGSPVKFFVIQGEIVAECGGERVRLMMLSFFEVKAGVVYSLKNNSQEDAFIYFATDAVDIAKEETMNATDKDHSLPSKTVKPRRNHRA